MERRVGFSGTTGPRIILHNSYSLPRFYARSSFPLSGIFLKKQVFVGQKVFTV